MSSFTQEDRKLLVQAAKDSAVTLAMQKEQGAQIKELFDVQGAHAEAITRIGLTQDMCQKRNDPGNKSERISAFVAVAAVVISALALIATFIF